MVCFQGGHLVLQHIAQLLCAQGFDLVRCQRADLCAGEVSQLQTGERDNFVRAQCRHVAGGKCLNL